MEDNYQKETRCTAGKLTHSPPIEHGYSICEEKKGKKEETEEQRERKGGEGTRTT